LGFDPLTPSAVMLLILVTASRVSRLFVYVQMMLV
jgi:hypothetical protein